MSVFEKSKWIWLKDGEINDQYGEFFAEFDAKADVRTLCNISVDFDYTLFVNGMFVASNQFGDFEHYKIYDTLDITEHLKEGRNTFEALVWHHGRDTQRYRYARAGIIFEVIQDGKSVLVSDKNIRSRQSAAYKSGYCKVITGQLGYSFLYDANKEEAQVLSGYGCDESVEIDKKCEFYARVGEKLVTEKTPCEAKVTVIDDRHYLIDLGRETVGVFTLDLFSESAQKITVAWGEHILDGGVRRMIGGRDFSLEYIAKEGQNSYTNYMLRLGCRYLEVLSEEPIKLGCASLLAQYYPIKEKAVQIKDELDRRIYDLCVRTLRLSMMEHYVDCPWREQCLYVFDSRNQMLCGYYAFEDGNSEYVRANHMLIGRDRRSDGLLSLCYPCGSDLAIPSFSLHWYTSLREYHEHTGDTELLKELFPKMISVMDVFVANRKDGLVCKFGSDVHWNFYDWSEHLEGTLRVAEAPIPDLVINTLFISALRSLKYICEVTGEIFAYEEVLSETVNSAKTAFYVPEKGMFKHTVDGEIFTKVGNSLAVLCGLADEQEARCVCENMVSGKASECSLSLKPFEYDAMLATDKEKYTELVLAEIRKNYKIMLDADATSAWETIEGAPAFSNAGSLCHGWSSVPVYYYHKLGIAEYIV